MANPARGEVRKTSEGYTARITLRGKERKTFTLPTCRDDDEAQARADLLAKLARDFRRAKVLDTPDAPKLLDMAASATPALLAGVVQVAKELVGGELPAAGTEPEIVTFRKLGEQWTSGALHEKWPDQVKAKDSELDEARLANLCKIDVGGMKLGDIPIDRFTLDHAEEAMRQLNSVLKMQKQASTATRRAYAQIIHRVVKLAVYPCRLINASPLPQGFLPKISKPPAYAFLYPKEDKALMAAPGVPLVRRLLYGVLAREGLRVGEAVGLRWRELDLDQGVLTLDENKTDDPRAWTLGRDVVRALAGWRKATEGRPSEYVFAESNVPVAVDGLAERLRGDLAEAGLTRNELFAKTAKRNPFRVHDLRGTFVTLALALGRSETWVSDRTGHTSSVMINRYKRASRSAKELGLGWLAPLDTAIPELGALALGGAAEALSSPPHRPMSSGSTGIRTPDRRIKNPQL